MDYPTYKMILDENDEGAGMKITSMVDAPAVLLNWVKFNESTPVKLAIQDEDQRIVMGVALIPDMPIERHDGDKTYYLTIDAENVLKTAIKFAKDNLSRSIDVNHSQEIIDGVVLFESFVTNENRVSSVKGFESVPMGTWFLTGKVNNDEVWNKVKAGELNGWSIDALFKFKKAETITDVEAEKLIKEIFSKL